MRITPIAAGPNSSAALRNSGLYGRARPIFLWSPRQSDAAIDDDHMAIRRSHVDLAGPDRLTVLAMLCGRDACRIQKGRQFARERADMQDDQYRRGQRGPQPRRKRT